MEMERTGGWIAVGSGIIAFCVAFVQVVRWIATIRDEHEMLLKHLNEAKSHHLDIHDLKASAARAERERDTLLAEVRGLRDDLNEFMTALVKDN